MLACKHCYAQMHTKFPHHMMAMSVLASNEAQREQLHRPRVTEAQSALHMDFQGLFFMLTLVHSSDVAGHEQLECVRQVLEFIFQHHSCAPRLLHGVNQSIINENSWEIQKYVLWGLKYECGCISSCSCYSAEKNVLETTLNYFFLRWKKKVVERLVL